MRLTLILATALLAGCALIPFTQEHTARLSVQYATLKYIDGDADKARRVVEIVSGAQALIFDGGRVSVAALEAEVRSRINWSKLDQADTLLVDGLISAAAEELLARVGDQELAPDKLLEAATVMAWISDAAALAM